MSREYPSTLSTWCHNYTVQCLHGTMSIRHGTSQTSYRAFMIPIRHDTIQTCYHIEIITRHATIETCINIDLVPYRHRHVVIYIRGNVQTWHHIDMVPYIHGTIQTQYHIDMISQIHDTIQTQYHMDIIPYRGTVHTFVYQRSHPPQQCIIPNSVRLSTKLHKYYKKINFLLHHCLLGM